MGCCISKCRAEHKNKKHSLEEQEVNQNVEDKLVISQAGEGPMMIRRPHPIIKHKIPGSPHSPTASSVSSFTCTTMSSASTLSTGSSKAVDRSFSNEFLWSCYRDNPHIARINSLRDCNTTKTTPGLATILKLHSPLQNNVAEYSFPTMPHKRVRSNSPTNLTRHKTFRKELQPSGIRTPGSPSPNALSKRIIHDNSSSSPKVSANPSPSPSRSRSRSAATPNNNNSNSRLGRRLQSSGGLRRRETCTYRVGSKIDESVVRDVVAKEDDHMDVDSMEVDIDNPLISLDCFIFL